MGYEPDELTTIQVESPTGGRHLYFFCPDGVGGGSTDQFGLGLDFRAEGNYVAAPGAINGTGTYKLLSGLLTDDPPPWPRFLSLEKRDRDPGEARPTGLDFSVILDALAHLPNDGDEFASRDDWLRIGAALHAETGGDDEGFAAFDGWSAQWYGYDPTATEAAWKSLKSDRPGGVTGWTIIYEARKREWEDPEQLAALDAELEESDESVFERLVGSPELRPAPKPPAAPSDRPVMRRPNGEPEATAHNAILYLSAANEKRGLGICHNAFTGRDEWRAGPIRDAHLTLIRVQIELAGMRNVGNDLTARAVRAVAERNAYHPIRDWLHGLTWDRKARLSEWLTTYMGAEDSAYVRAVARAALIGLVARVERPGCKHDHVLVLSGAQGIGKSTACKVLGGDWYGDNLPALRNDDREAGMWLPGHWLVELSEMAPTRKAEGEALKSFLSRATDEIRLPYARLADSVPRQCAFVATTNESEYLRDQTGGRRFWPITCGDGVDTEALASDRDQLFAEALAAFRDGEPWHLSAEAEAMAREAQAAATEEDPWEARIADYLDGLTDPLDDGEPPSEVEIRHVLANALEVPKERHGGQNSARVGAILRKLGWTHHRIGKHKTSVWRRQ